MMLKFKNNTISGLPTWLILVVIGLIGCSVILIELVSYRNSISETRRSFSQSQKKQLELLKTELDNEIRHLVQIFPAFIKSQEFLDKVKEATLSGPYFVYAPQQYGQPLDYWDQVQLVKRQIWMLNYFLPLIQSAQLDYIAVHLVDPHNNLVGNSSIPFLELQRDDTSFYAYPIKGLFQQFSKQSIHGMNKIQLSGKYFDQIIYDTTGRKTLYSALGFNKTNLKIEETNSGAETYSDNVEINIYQGQVTFKKWIELSSQTYNWRSKKREKTIIARVVAQKQLTDRFLLNIKERFGTDKLAIENDAQPVLSTGNMKPLPPEKSAGTMELEDGVFIFKRNPYKNDLLKMKLNLVVLTSKEELELNSFSFYRSLVVPAGVTVLLLIMTYFFIKSRPTPKTSQDQSQSSIQPEPVTDSIADRMAIPEKDQFLLIEESGETTTIPLDCVSHIRVSDHYCTIIYKKNDQWNNWMIIERLKTFEKRYDGLLVRLNRSTLINPNRIDKIQLLQRKLTMEGEPDNLLAISQASLADIKNIVKTRDFSS